MNQLTFPLSSGELLHSNGKIHHFIAGKNHYFDWAIFNCYVRSPEGKMDDGWEYPCFRTPNQSKTYFCNQRIEQWFMTTCLRKMFLPFDRFVSSYDIWGWVAIPLSPRYSGEMNHPWIAGSELGSIIGSCTCWFLLIMTATHSQYHSTEDLSIFKP